MKTLIVSEDKEIVADGKKILLEKGDKIVIGEDTEEAKWNAFMDSKYSANFKKLCSKLLDEAHKLNKIMPVHLGANLIASLSIITGRQLPPAPRSEPIVLTGKAAKIFDES